MPDGLTAEVLDALEEPILVLNSEGTVEFATPSFHRWPAAIPPRLTSIIEAFDGAPLRYVDQISDRWAEISVHPLSSSRSMVIFRDADEKIKAVENVKRLRLRVLTIQEDERRAISQNLHDELGQSMTALSMQIARLMDDARDPTLVRSLSETRAQVETVTKRMRQLFYRIRPPGLHDDSLTVALSDYCLSVAHASGLRIHFDADPDIPAFDGAEATALYRLLQEALNNTVKHASATAAWVALSAEEAAVSLTVEDDGVGFDPQSRVAGIGLVGLRERFEMVEGELHLDSRVGSGTRVTGNVPVRSPSSARR